MSTSGSYGDVETREVTLTEGDHEAVFNAPTSATEQDGRFVEMSVKENSRAQGEIPGDSGWGYGTSGNGKNIDISKCDTDTTNDMLTISYFGSPAGESGYKFVTTIEGTISYCGGGGSGDGVASDNDFTLLITDEHEVHVNPKPAYAAIGQWVKIRTYRMKHLPEGNNEVPVDVLWTLLDDELSASGNGGVTLLTDTELEAERSYIWVKAMLKGEFKVSISYSNGTGYESTTKEITIHVENPEINLREIARLTNVEGRDDPRLHEPDDSNARNKILIKTRYLGMYQVSSHPIQYNIKNHLNEVVERGEINDDVSVFDMHPYFANTRNTEDFVIDYGYDANGNGVLDSGEEYSSYNVYIINLVERDKSFNVLELAVDLANYDVGDALLHKFTYGAFRNPPIIGNSYNPTNSGVKTFAPGSGKRLMTHNFGADFQSDNFGVLNGRLYPNQKITMASFEWNKNSAGSKLIINHSEFYSSIATYLNKLNKNVIQNAYANGVNVEGLDPSYKMCSISLLEVTYPEYELDFEAFGKIGIGGADFTEGTIKILINRQQQHDGGINYIVEAWVNYPARILDAKIQDVWDYNYFKKPNPEGIGDEIKASASRSAASYQCWEDSNSGKGRVFELIFELDGELENFWYTNIW